MKKIYTLSCALAAENFLAGRTKDGYTGEPCFTSTLVVSKEAISFRERGVPILSRHQRSAELHDVVQKLY
jgi:hypothetical protein